jgi:hypothetical protein
LWKPASQRALLSADPSRINPITGIADRCAPAVNGKAATAEPPIPLMKSRRRIAFPKAGTTPIRTRLQQGFAIDEMGFSDQVAQQQF